MTRAYWHLPIPPAWSSFGGESRSDRCDASIPPAAVPSQVSRFFSGVSEASLLRLRFMIIAMPSGKKSSLCRLGRMSPNAKGGSGWVVCVCVCKWCASTPTAKAEKDGTLLPCMCHGLLIQLPLNSCKEDTMSSFQRNHIHCSVSLLTVPLA